MSVDLTALQVPSSHMEPPLLRPRNYPLHKELTLGPFFLNLFIGIVIGLAVQFLPDLFLEPYRRGFYCDDQTIRLSDKHSTVSASVLFLCILLLPPVLILITEFCRSSQRKELYSWRGFNCNQILVNVFKYYAYYLLGILLIQLLTMPTKYIVGELRPTFMDVCRPSYDILSCRNRTYIQDYKCRGTNNLAVKEARLSFYSGHAALATTAAVFFVIYVQSRIPRRSSVIVIWPLVQLLAICLALYTGYSRFVDGKHHLHDVIVGYIVGALIGYVTAKHIAGLRTTPGPMRLNEAKVQKIEVPPPSDDEAPAYKTSVVRIEPTELRLFD